MKRVPPPATGFRRAVADEALDEHGNLVYLVRLVNSRGVLVVTRKHVSHEAAAKEVFDWMDWSERAPVRLP